MRERGKRNTRRQRKERTNEIYKIERHIHLKEKVEKTREKNGKKKTKTNREICRNSKE